MNGLLAPKDQMVVTASVELAMDRMAVALQEVIEARKGALDALIKVEVGKLDIDAIITRAVRQQIYSQVDTFLTRETERVFREELSAHRQDIVAKIEEAVREAFGKPKEDSE